MNGTEMSSVSLLERFMDDPRTTKLYTEESKRKIHRAILVKRGKIIAEATNRYGTRSRGSGYSDRSIHAEKHVIKKLGNIAELRGADMYVMRHGRAERAEEFMCSKPCKSCQLFLEKCMREYGLKNVYYTAGLLGEEASDPFRFSNNPNYL